MIAAKLDLEYAIKSVEELERLLQVSDRFLPGTAKYQQMELEYSEKNIRTQQGLLWYLVRCRHAERERLYKRIGSYHIFRLNGFQLCTFFNPHFSLVLIGTKLATRINERIKKTNEKIKDNVRKFNNLVKAVPRTRYKEIQNWESICQIDDEYWISYLDSIAFPAMDADVRKALRNLNSLDRAFEEIERAKIEMTRMKEYLSQRLDAINSAMENLNDADGEDKALMNGCLVWLRKEKDVVLEMTGEVNKVFGESNADNVASEDEIENYLYEGEVSIDFSDIDETMYEYGENDDVDMEIIT